MISFIRGIAADMTENSVIVEAGGIGFEIFMTGKALSRIRIGEEVKIHTFFHVKEDGMQLYGFFSKDDLQVFRLLLAVNGIGPKGAVGVLSSLSADELRFAIFSDDVKTISKAPGIGKKTAQKLILELKDKLSLGETALQNLASDIADGDHGTQADRSDMPTDAMNQAVEALSALGYSQTDAYRAVKKVPESHDMDVESLLKAALKNL